LLRVIFEQTWGKALGALVPDGTVAAIVPMACSRAFVEAS